MASTLVADDRDLAVLLIQLADQPVERVEAGIEVRARIGDRGRIARLVAGVARTRNNYLRSQLCIDILLLCIAGLIKIWSLNNRPANKCTQSEYEHRYH
jgi:hypothetical protein